MNCLVAYGRHVELLWIEQPLENSQGSCDFLPQHLLTFLREVNNFL